MRRITIKLIAVSAMLITAISTSAAGVNIIPKPYELSVEEGTFTINEKTKIVYEDGLSSEANYLKDVIYPSTAMKLEVKEGDKSAKNTIKLSIDSDIEHAEGYKLEVTPKGVEIEASTPAGVFYGIQTLLQMLPESIESDKLSDNSLTIQAVSIEDYPQFAWRAIMLDASRYFFTVDYIKKFIDMMAMYKMNTLHFHLLDDTGWRLEVKKYPELTEIGSFRGEGEDRTGGYYTQDELRELVAYAAVRNVDIIPEIAFPAHFLAAVVACPWVSCTGEQLKVQTYPFISNDLLCAGNDKAIEFIKDVMLETFDIFPSKYLHIGGDEAVYTKWDECPLCQQRMKDEGLTESSELQAYLTNIVADFAKQHGRTVVGWDEILERGKVTQKVVSMVWRNMVHLDHVLELGQQAVIASSDLTYFDFPESNLPGEVKAATWRGPISVEKCYNIETEKYEGSELVLGVEACMWTDQFIHGTLLQEIDQLNENRSENYVEYQVLPRLLAVAEVDWTPQSKRDYIDFSERIIPHFDRLTAAGYHYRVPTPTIVSTTESANGYIVELSTPLNGATIHYTTNGESATPFDKLYTEPVEVKQLSDLRAVTAVSKTHFSVPIFFEEDYSKYEEYGVITKKLQAATVNSNTYKEILIDFTGKVSGDGEYQLALIPLTDKVNVEVADIKVLKHNDITAETAFNATVTNSVVTQTITISEWQAGTPYSAKLFVKGLAGNEGNFALFIKKIEE